MRTILTPLALVTTIGAAGAAFADTTTGTIAEVSSITGDVTLQNGMEFEFSDADASKLDNFGVGDTVSIDWVAVGDQMEGRQISPSTGAPAELTGIVVEANQTTGMVTLGNGMEIDFNNAEMNGLDNFSAGDTVLIQYATVGDEIQAITISPAGQSANVAEGTINELNDAEGTVTFADGAEYEFDSMRPDMLDNFSVGDRVAIHYVTQGDADVVLSISPVS